MHMSDDESSPMCEDMKQTSDFMEFFIDKTEQINVTTIGAPPPVFTDHVCSTTETFQPTTTEQLVNLIADAPNKLPSLDPVPTSLVKNCSSLLPPFLSNLLSRSLSLRATYRHHRKPPLTRHCLREGWTSRSKELSTGVKPNIRLEATWVCYLLSDDWFPESKWCSSGYTECIQEVPFDGECLD